MPRLIPALNNRGFSLIEMMMAVLIIMVSMLAVMSTTLVSIRTSLNNDMRDMATLVANQTGEALLAVPFTDPEVSGSTGGTTHTRVQDDSGQSGKGIPNTLQIVRGKQQTFNIKWVVTPLATSNSSSSKIVITVSYTNNGKTISRDSLLFKQATI